MGGSQQALSDPVFTSIPALADGRYVAVALAEINPVAHHDDRDTARPDGGSDYIVTTVRSRCTSFRRNSSAS